MSACAASASRTNDRHANSAPPARFPRICQDLSGNRRFESISLQRRVFCEPDFGAFSRTPPPRFAGSVRGCARCWRPSSESAAGDCVFGFRVLEITAHEELHQPASGERRPAIRRGDNRSPSGMLSLTPADPAAAEGAAGTACGCGAVARVTGLASYRCVDAEQHDAPAVDAEHRRSDDLCRAAIDRRFVSGRGGHQGAQHKPGRQGENFACHGEE